MSVVVDVDPAKGYNYKLFQVAKKTKGEFRTVGAPSKNLLKAQRKMLPKLEKAYHAEEARIGLLDICQGFLHGRGPVSCATKHIGYEATLTMDIEDFFNNVNMSRMMEIDTVEEYAIVADNQNNLVQGFATSPIIANIRSLGFMEDIYKNMVEKFSGCVDDFQLNIYADDIILSYNHKDKDRVAYNVKQLPTIIAKHLSNHGFKVNPKKTRVRYASQGYRRILGINVGDDHIRATRKIMRKIRAAKHQANKSSLGGLTNWSNWNMPKKEERK